MTVSRERRPRPRRMHPHDRHDDVLAGPAAMARRRLMGRAGRSTCRPCTSAIGWACTAPLADGGPATAGRAGRAGAASIPATHASGSSTRRSGRSSTWTTSPPHPDARRYSLPDGHAAVLLDPDSPWLVAPARAVRRRQRAARCRPLLEAYRTGEGVDWADYGPDVVEAQEALNRPQFAHFVGDWIEALPDIAARLRDGAGPGRGRGLRDRLVVDLDRAGVPGDPGRRHRYRCGLDRARQGARRSARASTDRVSFLFADAAERRGCRSLRPRDDLRGACTTWRSPAEVLAAARQLLAPGGAVLIADERVAETFTAPGDETDRLFYGYSVVACLRQRPGRPAVGRNGHGPAASGRRGDRTRGRLQRLHDPPDRARRFRFYRLDP